VLLRSETQRQKETARTGYGPGGVRHVPCRRKSGVRVSPRPIRVEALLEPKCLQLRLPQSWHVWPDRHDCACCRPAVVNDRGESKVTIGPFNWFVK
jgi:hypothetical protein